MLQAWSRRIIGLVLALAAVTLTARAVQAQTGKITGVVTDAASGQPLEGVQIYLPGTGYGNVTNASGRYFILSVPPGTYAVAARRIGYQTQEIRGVQVLIDVTREQDFKLATTTQQLQAQVITAEQTPLIAPGQTGSSIPITAEQIQALPVTSIEGALSLQQGFLQAPSSTDLISFNESRRNAQNPIFIRGGRGGETLLLIDGIPVQNFIYGGPALSLSPEAVQQIDLVKGGMGPEYGNALSGVINIATKEGSPDLAGAIKYQTSSLGGLGNTNSDLRDYNLVEGFLSGPIPGTKQKLRFMFSGRQERQADQVFEFDNDIFLPSQRPTTESNPQNGPNYLDLIPGWRSFGYNDTRQLFGKLAYYVTPTAKFTLTLLDNQKQRKPFDPNYLTVFNNALGTPAVTSTADSVVLLRNLTGVRGEQITNFRVVQGSINSSQQLATGKFDLTRGRTSYRVVGGAFRTKRTTCNYFQGVCLQNNFADVSFTEDAFAAPLIGSCTSGSTCGTDPDFGGEKLTTYVGRGDVRSQVTDHHELSGGLLYQKYDFKVDVFRKGGTNSTRQYHQIFANKPFDFGTYLQDKIEYDFVTVKLGARFDYGKVPGTFFADPLDPTNGTTALDVCANPADPRWSKGVNYTFVDENGVRQTQRITPAADWHTSAGCKDDATLKEAAKVATFDDFAAAKARKQFSPRIGISFPLTQGSAVFFNFGRYSQNPLLYNLLNNTGIGTPAEGTTTGPAIAVVGVNPGLIGNPNLKIEQATTYEIGYNSEFGKVFALSAALFNKNQTGLTGVRTGGQRKGRFGLEQVYDPGGTYGGATLPSYSILVNQDFQSVRGFDVQLRRRVQNYWGFDINYSYSRARTNASEPEHELERTQQGDPSNLVEVPSDIDQAHVFNASLIGQVDQKVPSFRGAWLLRNTSAALTVSAASGFPYTPQIAFGGVGLNQLERNSARAPSTSQFNFRLSKGFRMSNLRYDAFVQVDNLFDKKNCIQVFNTTGSCDAGAPDQSKRHLGNAPPVDLVSSTYKDRAWYFGERRSIFGGVRVSF